MNLSQQENFFPKKEILDQIDTLKANPELKDVTLVQSSQLQGKSTEEIAKILMELRKSGKIGINFGKTPAEEQVSIRQAVELEIDGQTPDLIFYEQAFANENDILRSIVSELVDKKNEVSQKARQALENFIANLVNNLPDLIKDEWVKFIVNHKTTKNIKSIDESHHWGNFGIPDKKDPLRQPVIELVTGIMEKVKDGVENILNNLTEDEKHSTPEMNKPDVRLLLLGLAELSNFVRGGIYYGRLNGKESLKGYMPRWYAADALEKENKEESKNS
jgi:hypothetical protein